MQERLIKFALAGIFQRVTGLPPRAEVKLKPTV